MIAYSLQPVLEELEVTSGNATLAATLARPRFGGKHPAVVLLHGSGDDGRSNRYYQYLVRAFICNGIAVVTYDKRGCGESGGNWRESPFRVLADDAAAVVAATQLSPWIDPARVGIWGGSEGGALGAWVASEHPDLCFLILQSTSGVSFAQQNLYQTEMETVARGYSANLETRLNLQKLMHSYARTGQGWDAYAEAFDDARDQPWIAELGAPLAADDWWWTWYGTKMDFDASQVLRHVGMPVLAVWGENDSLVPVEASRAAMAKSLELAGNEDVKLRVFPKADHSMITENGEMPHLWFMAGWARKHASARGNN